YPYVRLSFFLLRFRPPPTPTPFPYTTLFRSPRDVDGTEGFMETRGDQGVRAGRQSRSGAIGRSGTAFRCSDLVEHLRDRPCRSEDRKSTRLNSSHLVISYAVFCLKKKKTEQS